MILDLPESDDVAIRGEARLRGTVKLLRRLSRARPPTRSTASSGPRRPPSPSAESDAETIYAPIGLRRLRALPHPGRPEDAVGLL